MRKNLFVILAFMAISYTSCKQSAYKVPLPSPASSYFPQTIGSTWTYRDSIFGLPTDTIPIYGVKNDIVTFTINGSTTDFNSIICYNANVVSQKNGSGTAYYYALKHVFGLLESTPPWGLIDLQLLVDTASVGYTWISVPAPFTLLNGYPVRTINTIKEKNITKVVGGVTFNSVTHSATNFQININGNGFQNIANFDFYLAPGVGLIEKDAYYYGYLNETETIIDYSIH